MLKTAALIFGIIMLLVGILGFIPQVTPGGMLLGIFHVNDIHNWIHILTGVVSILCGINSNHASRLFFQIFGIIYGIVAILAFFLWQSTYFGAGCKQLGRCNSSRCDSGYRFVSWIWLLWQVQCKASSSRIRHSSTTRSKSSSTRSRIIKY